MTAFNIRDFGALPVQEGGTSTANGLLIRNAIQSVLSMGDGSTLHFGPGFWRMHSDPGTGANLTGVGDPTGAVVGKVTGEFGQSWLSKTGDTSFFVWDGCHHIGFEGLSLHGRNSGALCRVVGGSGVFFRNQRNVTARGFQFFNGADAWRVENVHWYEPHAAFVQIGNSQSYQTDAPVTNGIMDGVRAIGSRQEPIELQCHSTNNLLRNFEFWSCNFNGQEEYIDAGGGNQIDFEAEDGEIDHRGDQIRAVMPQVEAIRAYVVRTRASKPGIVIFPATLDPGLVGLPVPDPSLPNPFLLAQTVDDGGSLYPFLGTPIQRGIRIKVENGIRPIRPKLRRIQIRLSSTDGESCGVSCEATDAAFEDIDMEGDTNFSFSLGGTGNGTLDRCRGHGARGTGVAARTNNSWVGRDLDIKMGPAGANCASASVTSFLDVRGRFEGGIRGVYLLTSTPDCVASGTFVGQSGAAFRADADALRARLEHATVLGSGQVADLYGVDQVVQAVRASGPGTGTAIFVRAGASGTRIEAVPVAGYTTPLSDLGTGTQAARMADGYLLQTWSGVPADIADWKTELEVWLARRGAGVWLLPRFGQAPEVDPGDSAKTRFRAAMQAGVPLPGGGA